MGEERRGMVANSANKFQKRIRVLAVDDDQVSLRVLEALLRYCNYHATMARDPVTVRRMLKEGKKKFHLVIIGVLMPYMIGFDLLKLAIHEMDLPVIILSAYEDKKTMMKGITLGACEYWVKPVCAEQISNMWKYVLRKKMSVLSRRNKVGNVDANEKAQSETAGGERAFEKSSRKYSLNERNDGDGENKENVSESSTQKKPRMTWTNELNGKFVEAVRQIGIDNAAPKKIMAMMGVDNITRESVASHLQKYRLRLKNVRDNARNPLADASERYNSIWNKPESFNHYHGHGTYSPFASVASSNPTSLFTRTDHPSAIGARGALVHGSNMISKDAVPGSSLLPSVRQWPFSNNSYANMPNDTMRSDAFASSHSGNYSSSYGNILRGKTSKGNHSGNSFTYRSNVGMPLPINRFPVQPSSWLGHQPSVNRNPFGDIGNCLCNSRQAAVKLPGIGHKDGRTSLGPSQVNFPGINQVPSLAASSVGQMPMCRNEPRNQMAGIMSNTTFMACTHEKNAPFDVLNNNNTSSAEMFNGNIAFGTSSRTSINQVPSLATSSAGQIPMRNNGPRNQMAGIVSNATSMAFTHEKTAPFYVLNNNSTSPAQMFNGNFALGTASRASSGLPGLQMGTSVTPTQMLNGGCADGALPMQEHGRDHLETFADYLKYIDDDFFLETDVPEGNLSVDGNIPNEDISIYDYLDIA